MDTMNSKYTFTAEQIDALSKVRAAAGNTAKARTERDTVEQAAKAANRAAKIWASEKAKAEQAKTAADDKAEKAKAKAAALAAKAEQAEQAAAKAADKAKAAHADADKAKAEKADADKVAKADAKANKADKAADKAKADAVQAKADAKTAAEQAKTAAALVERAAAKVADAKDTAAKAAAALVDAAAALDACDDAATLAVARAKAADADARAAAVAKAKADTVAKYNGNAAALLRVRKFDDKHKGIDAVAEYASVAATIKANSADAAAVFTAKAAVKLDAVALLSDDGRKAANKAADGVRRLVAAYHNGDADAADKANSLICDYYRALGLGDIKPRRKGKASDVADILCAAYDITDSMDDTAAAVKAIGVKIQASACASVQARDKRDALALEYAEKDRKAAERAAAKAERDAKRKAADGKPGPDAVKTIINPSDADKGNAVA